MAIDYRIPMMLQTPDITDIVQQGVQTFRDVRLDPYRQQLLQMQVESNRAAAERTRQLLPLELQQQQLALEQAQFEQSPEQRQLAGLDAATRRRFLEAQATQMEATARTAPELAQAQKLQAQANLATAKLQADKLRRDLKESGKDTELANLEKLAKTSDSLLANYQSALESGDTNAQGVAVGAFTRNAMAILGEEDAKELLKDLGEDPATVISSLRALAMPEQKQVKKLLPQEIARLSPQDRVAYLNAEAQTTGKDVEKVGDQLVRKSYKLDDQGNVTVAYDPVFGDGEKEKPDFEKLMERPGIKAYYDTLAKDYAKLYPQVGTARAAKDSMIELLDRMINNTEGLKSAHGPTSSQFPSFVQETLNYEADADQLMGDLFMQGIQSMRGFGSLSNAEGQKVAQAATSFKLKLKPEDALAELRRIKTMVEATYAASLEDMKAMEAELAGLAQGRSRFLPGGLNTTGRLTAQERMAELVRRGFTKEQIKAQMTDEGYFQ